MGPDVELNLKGTDLSGTLEHLRNILVNSLPRENVGQRDRDRLKRQARLARSSSNAVGSRPPSALAKEERECRLKSFKERQNEERYKKLEEIKAHAMAAQRFKEQKEHERRKRMEELKMREESHRQQVEERKKMIEDAERERLESIIRRNQEREARMEAKKKNERSSMVFAFGSSTPRMLEPLDNAASFWGHRRATSTHNITYNAAPLTRRQSERELDGGSKKRATSAGGLERSEATTPQHPAGCISGYVGRRRTDLMPTIPSKESPTTPPRKPFARSPGRAYSMSRLDQLAKPRKRTVELPTLSEIAPPPLKPLSRPNHSSVSRSMSHLAVGKAGAPHNAPQRPMRRSDSRSMHQLSAAPLPPPRTTRTAELRQKKLVTSVSPSQVEGPSRPGSSLSQQSASSVASSSVSVRHRTSVTPKRQRPVSIAVTGITSDQIKNGPVDVKKENKPPIPKTRKSSLQKSQEKIIRKKTAEASPKSALSPASTPKVLQSPVDNKSIVKESYNTENEDKGKMNGIQQPQLAENQKETIPAQPKQLPAVAAILVDKEVLNLSQEPTRIEKPSVESQEQKIIEQQVTQIQDKTLESVQQEQLAVSSSELLESSDMSTSFSSKRLITTEEEAKAALAERRRLAREEAERQAEMERKRLEEEARLELERQQKEEEQQRLLIEQQRAAEEARLKEAIREAQKREEEEKQRKEEEQRLRLLKEEAERKAREEAERQKAELQEKLKNEEKEREARRKRVEAIMLRTRGKTNSGATPQSEEKNEENKSEKMNGSKIESYENKTIDENIKSNVETNKLDESKIILTENKISVTENGHKNEKDVETVNNLIQLDSLKNANTVIANTINTDDSINSNDGWQENNTKADLLM